MKNQDNYFINQLDNVTAVRYYADGQTAEISKGDSRFNEIISRFAKLLDGYREMPAFGVSLDNETVEAMKSGEWVEFVFQEVYVHNGMPYKRLLMNIQAGNSGFNLIRNYNEKYEGRCFYVELNEKTMYNFINNCT
ncbi:MAG: hypothetical protein J6J23_02255 [Clostridia bacterium]|nr:hypothetical protein [Clostridia bacterium]